MMRSDFEASLADADARTRMGIEISDSMAQQILASERLVEQWYESWTGWTSVPAKSDNSPSPTQQHSIPQHQPTGISDPGTNSFRHGSERKPDGRNAAELGRLLKRMHALAWCLMLTIVAALMTALTGSLSQNTPPFGIFLLAIASMMLLTSYRIKKLQ